MNVFRKITDACKDECKSKGIDVIVSAADGEFLPLMVRGKKGNPLTQHQLSKDVWAETTKLSKHEILKRFKQATKDCNREGRVLASKNKALSKIATPNKGWKKDKNETRKDSPDDCAENTDVEIETSTFMVVDGLQNAEIEMSSENQTEETDILDLAQVLTLHEESDEAHVESPLDLSEGMIKEILELLKGSNEKKWNNVTENDLSKYFRTEESLNKFTVKELVNITKLLNSKRNQQDRLKITGTKKAIIEQLLSGPRKKTNTSNKRRKKSVPSLQVLSNRILMKRSYPKKVLNIAYCNFIWDNCVTKWRSEAKVDERISIFGIADYLQPYYVPDSTLDPDNFDITVYDKTHLGSNLRKALCLDKIDGISKKAWELVSEKNPSVLNAALIEVTEEGKILDQMKEKFARSLFTEEVEAYMNQNGNQVEAEFCRVIRNGLYAADDTPGIPATERCKMRIELINWLKEGVDFGEFPPYGARIKGLSYILYEGLRSSAEAKLYLYALAKPGTYCVRAPNTLCSESFFSTMQEMDPWGQGVLTAEGVEKHISDFTAITALKMEDERSFYIRTKKDAAYPVITTESESKIPEEAEDSDKRPYCTCRADGWIKCIVPKDHFFDTPGRARRRKGERPFKFRNYNDPARGDLPIRAQYGYKFNEGNILVSKRLGLNFNDMQ